MAKKPTKGPQSKHSIKGLRLGKLYFIGTDNPESSRTILRNLAKDAGLRSIIMLGDGHVKLVLWNDEMFGE